MISIIVPTYNEKDNLDTLFEKIKDSMTQDYEIILVDDNSPDGTAKEAERLSNAHPIKLIVRKENPGLSQSVIRGINESEGEKVVVMDGDLQHPPEKIPNLVAHLDNNDITIGSRYVNGDSVDHWSIKRKATSFTASIMAKIALREYDLSDPMSGFFAFSKNDLDTDNLDAEGFKILLEILSRNNGLKVKEVSYRFQPRKNGESSLGLDVVVDYTEQIAKITLEKIGIKNSKKLVQLIEFMVVGGTGVLVNSIIFLLAVQNSLHYSIAGALAFIGALQWNFLWNRKITFSKSTKSFKHQYFYFTAVNFGGFIIYELLLFALIGQLNIWEPLANIVAIFGGFLWNFVGSDKIAFQ